MKRAFQILIAFYDVHRMRSNKKYALKMAANALYQQVEYNDYSLTMYIESAFKTDDEIAVSIMYSLHKDII
jgi:hypothetical protein